MRELVRGYFATSLDEYVEKLNDAGLSDRSLDLLREELSIHEDANGGCAEISDCYLDAGTLDGFRATAGLSEAQWVENEPSLRREVRKARRDQIRELLRRVESLLGLNRAGFPGGRSL